MTRCARRRRAPSRRVPRRASALLLLTLATAFAALPGCGGPGPPGVATLPPVATGDAALAGAFEDRASGVQVEGAGRVVRLLPDDVEGARHQRFVLRLASGQTLLIAHNIDVAPRLEGLSAGVAVAFRGEYEWNAQGGVVHWTHRDPSGEHPGGWLRSGGRTVQ